MEYIAIEAQKLFEKLPPPFAVKLTNKQTRMTIPVAYKFRSGRLVASGEVINFDLLPPSVTMEIAA